MEIRILCRKHKTRINTDHRRRRDSTVTVELSRVCGVNAPVSSRDPISCAVELLRLVTSDDTMTSLLKKLSISIKSYVA